MKCESCMDLFLALDNGRVLPIRVQVHLLRCSRCRDEITRLAATFSSLRDTDEVPPPDTLADAVMAAVNRESQVPARQVRTRFWVIAGLVIIGGIVLEPFNRTLAWLTAYFGNEFQVPLAIIMGLVISAYVAIFAGTHGGEIRKLTTAFRRYMD